MNTPAETGGLPGPATMEERVHRLEVQADALAEAIEVLVRGLEGGPDGRATEQARRRGGQARP